MSPVPRKRREEGKLSFIKHLACSRISQIRIYLFNGIHFADSA